MVPNPLKLAVAVALIVALLAHLAPTDGRACGYYATDAEIAEWLDTLRTHPDADARAKAADNLSIISNPLTAPQMAGIVQGLDDSDARVREYLLQAVGMFRPVRFTREMARELFGEEIVAPLATAAMPAATRDIEIRLREIASRAVAMSAAKVAVMKCLRDESENARIAAIYCLTGHREWLCRDTLPQILAVLGDESARVQGAAVYALGYLGASHELASDILAALRATSQTLGAVAADESDEFGAMRTALAHSIAQLEAAVNEAATPAAGESAGETEN